MPATAVVGLQWGDEGKGKVVDLLAGGADYVVRFNGGDNAGHAVKVGTRRFGLQLVPSSIFHSAAIGVIAAGTVVNPHTLLEEVEELEAAGFSLANLAISDRAHLVLPWHLDQDGARGQATTRKGIGPAYEDKAGRRFALRTGDLLLTPAALRRKLTEVATHVRARSVLEGTLELLRRFARRFRGHVQDTTRLLQDALDQGRHVLLEGAQGALLDLDHGTFPFVTASSTTAGGACTGAGLSPRQIGRVVGVLKAYTTRVSAGPFPSEAAPRDADLLRKRGLEVGAATGLLRRCGWLDLVALRHATRINRPDELALTKLDVVARLERIPVCVGYRIGRRTIDDFPSRLEELERVRPIYEEVEDAASLVELVEERLATPVRVLSVGPARGDTITRSGRKTHGWRRRLGLRLLRERAAQDR